MGAFIRFLVLLAVVAAALAVVLVQLVVPAVASAAIRQVASTTGIPLAVDVRTSLDGVLLHGRIDAITITGSGVRAGSLAADGVSLTVSDVAVLDRSFTSIQGTLTNATIAPVDGSTVRFDRLTVTGASSQVTAVGELTSAEVASEIEARLASSSIVPRVVMVSVTGGQVRLTSGRDSALATLAIDPQGRLVLDIQSTSLGMAGPVTILDPPSDGSWRLTSLKATATGMRITAVLRAAAIPGLGSIP